MGELCNLNLIYHIKGPDFLLVALISKRCPHFAPMKPKAAFPVPVNCCLFNCCFFP